MAAADESAGDPTLTRLSRFRVALGLVLVGVITFLLDDSRSNSDARLAEAGESLAIEPGSVAGPNAREDDFIRRSRGGAILETGRRVEGLPDGEWTTYHESGGIESRRTYERGVLNGVCETWFPTGVRRSRTEWVGGMKQGLETVWTESGVAILEGRNEGGRRTGTWIWRWPNGNALEEGEYGLEGRIGVWRKYFENGRVQGEGRFSGETPVAPWKVWDPEGRLLTERFDPAVLK